MARHLLIRAALVAAAGFVSAECHAQLASIGASATVLSRSLALRSVTSSGDSGALIVQIDGCRAGTLTAHARLLDGRIVPITRQTIEARDDCRSRDFTVSLQSQPAGVGEYLIALEQTDALLAPAVSQLVVPATATHTSARLTRLF